MLTAGLVIKVLAATGICSIIGGFLSAILSDKDPSDMVIARKLLHDGINLMIAAGLMWLFSQS